jgi:lactate dehydrogenase-like 2-hydroxyacid dehydrogenase
VHVVISRFGRLVPNGTIAFISASVSWSLLRVFRRRGPLLRAPNATLTPHIAGASLKTVRIAADQAAEEVRRWLEGLPPLNPC